MGRPVRDAFSAETTDRRAAAEDVLLGADRYFQLGELQRAEHSALPCQFVDRRQPFAVGRSGNGEQIAIRKP
ncbi:hypothetical protein [Streptomyces geranii]|uniref:hypothetical protein n=1 Tax=Streptomyces geranii TaxID=2058923 RepID=UPI001300A8CB|nr:hypothetical protein [Streptomyces geranii]